MLLSHGLWITYISGVAAMAQYGMYIPDLLTAFMANSRDLANYKFCKKISCTALGLIQNFSVEHRGLICS